MNSGSLPPGWSVEALEQIAHGLREIQVRPVRPGYLSRWLHGPQYTDIFVDFAPRGDLVRFEASFGGHLLLYQNQTLRTGKTDEMDVPDGGTSVPKSRFVQEHAQLDATIVAGIRILLAGMADRYLADQLERLLPQPPRWPAA